VFPDRAHILCPWKFAFDERRKGVEFSEMLDHQHETGRVLADNGGYQLFNGNVWIEGYGLEGVSTFTEKRLDVGLGSTSKSCQFRKAIDAIGVNKVWSAPAYWIVDVLTTPSFVADLFSDGLFNAFLGDTCVEWVIWLSRGGDKGDAENGAVFTGYANLLDVCGVNHGAIGEVVEDVVDFAFVNTEFNTKFAVATCDMQHGCELFATALWSDTRFERGASRVNGVEGSGVNVGCVIRWMWRSVHRGIVSTTGASSSRSLCVSCFCCFSSQLALSAMAPVSVSVAVTTSSSHHSSN